VGDELGTVGEVVAYVKHAHSSCIAPKYSHDFHSMDAHAPATATSSLPTAQYAASVMAVDCQLRQFMEGTATPDALTPTGNADEPIPSVELSSGSRNNSDQCLASCV